MICMKKPDKIADARWRRRERAHERPKKVKPTASWMFIFSINGVSTYSCSSCCTNGERPCVKTVEAGHTPINCHGRRPLVSGNRQD